MKKRTRLTALLLALALSLTFLLTACSESVDDSDSADETVEIELDEAETDEESSSELVAEANLPDDIPAEALEDVVSFLTDGAYNADTVVASFGDIDVTAAEALYWVVYEQYSLLSYYNYYYSYYYGSNTISMTDLIGEDVTVGDSIFSLGMEDVLMYAVVAQKAMDLGLELSEDEIDALENMDAENVAYYGESLWETAVENGEILEEDFTDEERDAWIQERGEEFYAHTMMYNSTTTEAMKSIYRNHYYYSAVEEYLFEDGGEYAPTDAVLSDYIDDNGIVWGRCILFSTEYCEDDEEAAAVKVQADETYAMLCTLSGEELSETFTEMQTEYDISGYTAGEVQVYTSTDGENLVEGYYDGLVQLAPGEICMTDETVYGYFILLREEDQPEDIESSYISNTFYALVDQWLEESGVTCNMDQLNVADYFVRLENLQAIIDNVDFPEEDTETE